MPSVPDLSAHFKASDAATAWQSLTHLSLGENKLEGSIPPEVGNMTSLQYLYLYNNKVPQEKLARALASRFG